MRYNNGIRTKLSFSHWRKRATSNDYGVLSIIFWYKDKAVANRRIHAFNMDTFTVMDFYTTPFHGFGISFLLLRCGYTFLNCSSIGGS